MKQKLQEYEFLQESTFAVNNVDSAVATIAACIQIIMDKKNLNPMICGDLIGDALISGLDSVGAVEASMPIEVAMKHSQKIGKVVNKKLVGYLRSL